VSSPHATYSPDPEYSDIARRAKLQGTVLISLIVDKLGAVRDVRLVRPLGLGLDERSVEAVQTWKFKPAEKDSQPVASMITLETKFQLY
jgi:TonB family protein